MVGGDVAEVTHFASTEPFAVRTLEQQHELLAEIVETFDAELVEPGTRASTRVETGFGHLVSAGLDEPAGPDWDQRMLFDAPERREVA
jgi:hypothetical protein